MYATEAITGTQIAIILVIVQSVKVNSDGKNPKDWKKNSFINMGTLKYHLEY